jgi:hypothetical protein
VKKIIGLFMLIASLLFVFSCTNPGGGGTDKYAAPTVKTADQLPDTGATSAPASDTDAMALYSGAMAAFGQALGTEAGLGNAKGTTQIGPYTIDWTGAYGGGTVNVTGSYGGSSTSPDPGLVPVVGTKYTDLMHMILNAVINGTITGVTFAAATGDTYSSYTVSGDLKETMDMEAGIDYTLNADTSSTVTMDLSFGLSYGVALSILRSDGVGAKFVITFGGSIDVNNVSLTDPSAIQTELTTQLGSKTATLSVYDDSDTLIYSSTLTLAELMASQGMGGF